MLYPVNVRNITGELAEASGSTAVNNCDLRGQDREQDRERGVICGSRATQWCDPWNQNRDVVWCAGAEL
eukprot:360113-Chlamydomonas_euryale.AAC.7